MLRFMAAYFHRRSQRGFATSRRHTVLQQETAARRCQPSFCACLNLGGVLVGGLRLTQSNQHIMFMRQQQRKKNVERVCQTGTAISTAIL